MLKSSSLLVSGLAALGFAAAGVGLLSCASNADAAKRTDNVSIQILATANNHGETEECG